MGGRGGGRGGSNPPSTKLFVGSLPDTVRCQDLTTLFEKHGNVVECDIVKDYAFVHFSNIEESKSAVNALDGFEFMGSRIKVEHSRSTVRQKPGMGGREDCYKCGGNGHWSRDCPSGERRERGGGPMRRGARGGHSSRDDPYDDPYADPYGDPYASIAAARRERLLRGELLSQRDNYVRPPPDYYARRSALLSSSTVDPYDEWYKSRYGVLPPSSRAAGLRPPRM